MEGQPKFNILFFLSFLSFILFPPQSSPSFSSSFLAHPASLLPAPPHPPPSPVHPPPHSPSPHPPPLTPYSPSLTTSCFCSSTSFSSAILFQGITKILWLVFKSHWSLSLLKCSFSIIGITKSYPAICCVGYGCKKERRGFYGKVSCKLNHWMVVGPFKMTR